MAEQTIISGFVDDSGNVKSGEGFTVTHLETGYYEVNFVNSPFSSYVNVVANAQQGGDDNHTNLAVTIRGIANDNFYVGISGLADQPWDSSFMFIAVGQ